MPDAWTTNSLFCRHPDGSVFEYYFYSDPLGRGEVQARRRQVIGGLRSPIIEVVAVDKVPGGMNMDFDDVTSRSHKPKAKNDRSRAAKSIISKRKRAGYAFAGLMEDIKFPGHDVMRRAVLGMPYVPGTTR